MPYEITEAPEKLEGRAEALHDALFRGPDALLAEVQRAVPDFSGREEDWSADVAKRALATEHGCATFAELLTKAGSNSSPLRRLAVAMYADAPDEFALVLRSHPELLQARGTHGHSPGGIAARVVTHNRSIPLVRGSESQFAMLDRLLEAGADPSAASSYGWTALHTAAMSGDTELTRTLLAAHADPAAVTWAEPGATPLSYALFYAHDETARLLAAPTSPHNLRTAAGLGDIARIEELTPDGSLRDDASKDRGFYRPLLGFPKWAPSNEPAEVLGEALTFAARNDQVEAMEALVAKGADVNSNAYRGTPILWATYSGRTRALTWLLNHGADPSLVHDFGGASHGIGATALHLAAQFGDRNTIELLVEHGADVTIRDAGYGGTPAEWAEHSGNTDVMPLLGN